MLRIFGYLGQHAAWVLFGGVFLGLLIPQLAALCRPLLAPAVVALLLAVLLRVDLGLLASYRKRPLFGLLLLGLLLFLSPVATWWVLSFFALPEALVTALVLMAAAPPILAAASIALLLDLDGSLALLVSLVATLLAPLTLPPLALLLLGLELKIGAGELMLRLALIVALAFAGAYLVRRLAGGAWIASHATHIDGFVVVVMLIFAIAIMDGVTGVLITDPAKVLIWLAAAFVANPLLQAAGSLCFAVLGRRQALTAGLLCGNRNMGILLAAIPAGSDVDVALFFAIAQIPMYMLPAMLSGIYRRLLSRDTG